MIRNRNFKIHYPPTFNMGRAPSNNSSPFGKISQVSTPRLTTSLHYGLFSPFEEINSAPMARSISKNEQLNDHINNNSNRMQIENPQHHRNYHPNFSNLDLKIYKSESVETQSMSIFIYY